MNGHRSVLAGIQHYCRRRLSKTQPAQKLLLLVALLSSHMASAELFNLPVDGSTVVGHVRVVVAGTDNTLLDIARRSDVGYHEITEANPEVDVWTPNAHDKIVIPTQYILPPKPWRGVVINISQRRLFYFLPVEKDKPAQVVTFPISIAREGWSTPLGETKIIGKYKDPGWFMPKSIQAERRQEGETDFPTYFPPGPDNPMGMLAIQLGFSGIFIHGTNRPWGVGMRTSHGCLHLYPEDAAMVFPLISAGIPVRVIDEPVLVGIRAGQLVVASYEPVMEYDKTTNLSTRTMMALSLWLDEQINTTGHSYQVDWNRVQNITETVNVVPLSIAPGGATYKELIAGIPVEPYRHLPYGKEANDATAPPPTQTIVTATSLSSAPAAVPETKTNIDHTSDTIDVESVWD